jgi:hypothetical protein
VIPPSVRYRSPRVVAMLASRWLWFAIVLGIAGAVAQLVTVVVGGLLFLAWFHRAYGNLRALGVTEPRYKRGWAIGAWFIPFANLVLPKQMANDLWRAGDPSMQPNDPGWQGRPVAPLLHWWWAFYLVGSVVRQEVRAGGLRAAGLLPA